MKHILVTGGAGFIGANLISVLLKSYEVTSIDNFDDFYTRRQKELNLKPLLQHKNFHFIQGDIRNTNDLEKALNIDVIIHLAAKVGVRSSLKNPMLYEDVNVSGTLNLLNFAKIRGIIQFIFASSSSVYGINENMPWNEEERLLPISPYAATKLNGEMLGHVYSKLYGIRFLALRFFTVYGPGQRPDLVIHKFLKSILKDESIPVYGDGSASRDYTFINDIVKGIVAAINYDRSDFEIINLGNHKAITLTELIEAIEELCNKKALINNLPNQPGDILHTSADISKARKLLNYYPSTSLANGLVEFYKWYINNSSDFYKDNQ